MSKSEFASADLTMGQMNAIVKKLGGYEGALSFLQGETTVDKPRLWRVRDGIIYFSVTSDGTTGQEWIARLEKKHIRISNDAINMLLSKDFKSTSGPTREIAVLKATLFGENDRHSNKIRAVATKNKLHTPNAEIACLISDAFSGKEIEALDLDFIVTMHEPIKDTRVPLLFCSESEDGESLLDVSVEEQEDGWYDRCGFAFVIYPHIEDLCLRI